MFNTFFCSCQSLALNFLALKLKDLLLEKVLII